MRANRRGAHNVPIDVQRGRGKRACVLFAGFREDPGSDRKGISDRIPPVRRSRVSGVLRMELSQKLRCPRCDSGNYTSLPFGNELDLDGCADTYQCLRCGLFFARNQYELLTHFLKRITLRAHSTEDNAFPGNSMAPPRKTAQKGQRPGIG